jgi:hypothetical protein
VETPELDKIAEHSEDGQVIGEFLDWAADQGYALWHPERGYLSTGNALNQYFNIDPVKADDERKAALAEIHKACLCQRGATT